MGFNLVEALQQKISDIMPCKWSKGSVKYLGILIGRSHADTLVENLMPLIKYIQEKCQRWNIHPLSLLGKIVAIKIILLPMILFIFWNVILEISVKSLNKIQGILNRFVWGHKNVLTFAHRFWNKS